LKDDWRCVSGDGSWETDDIQSPFLSAATKLQSSTHLKTYGVTVAWVDTEHESEDYSEIRNHAPACPSSNAEYDPESDPESISLTADTAHHEAVCDKSSAVQLSIKMGMTV